MQSDFIPCELYYSFTQSHISNFFILFYFIWVIEENLLFFLKFKIRIKAKCILTESKLKNTQIMF